MALRYLNAEELEKWKAQNPGKTYFDTAGNPVSVPSTTKDLGFLGNLARTVSKPFRVGGGALQELGYTVGDIVRMAQGRNPLERPEQYFGLTQEESQALYEDPLKEGLKSAAGVMSYAVPAGAAEGATTAGARIGTAAARGAGAGTLGSFALSESGKELETALKGAGLGFLMGGALQGSSELIKAAKKRGGALKRSGQEGFDKLAVDDLKVLDDKSVVLKEIESQIKNIDKIQADKFPISPSTMKRLGYSPQELSKLKNSLLDDMSKRGFSINSADDLANNLGNYRRALLQEKEHILARMGNKQLVGTGEITKSLKRFSDIVGENKTTTRMLNDEISNIFGKGYSIEKLPKRMNTAQVVRLKETIDDIAGGFEKAMAADTSSVASAQLLKKIRDASRGVLTGNKSLDDILEKMSNTYKLEPAIMEAPIISQNLIQKAAMQTKKQLDSLGIKRAQELRRLTDEARALEALNQIGLKIPLTDASIPIPINPKTVGSSVQYRVGSVLEGLPELSFLRNAGQRAVPAVAGLAAGTQGVGTQGVGTQPIYPTTQGVQQGVGAQGVSPLNLMLAQEVLNGNISAAEANAVLSLLGMSTGTGKLTEKQKLFKSAAQTAGEALAMLESGQARTGKIQGVGTAVGKFFGTQAPGQTDYLAKLDGARMAAISALSGANVPPSEYERMRNLIPEPNDEYNIAVQKLRSFQQVMNNYAQSYGSDTSADTTGVLQTLGLQ